MNLYSKNMKIHILSDLHLEFGPFTFPNIKSDIVVLAGDVHTKLNGIRWIKKTITKTPVIYIMGNHEFYGQKYPRLIEKIKDEAKGTNIHVLENEFVEIDGYRFFGATLWTDMALITEPQIASYEALRMNDYKKIRVLPSYRKLSPKNTISFHYKSVSALKKFLANGNPETSIVVTHHAPSLLSLPEKRREELISSAYASNLDSLITKYNPKLWIHGHIHHSQNYLIGQTQIISNPRAYIDEENPNFNPKLVMEMN